MYDSVTNTVTYLSFMRIDLALIYSRYYTRMLSWVSAMIYLEILLLEYNTVCYRMMTVMGSVDKDIGSSNPTSFVIVHFFLILFTSFLFFILSFFLFFFLCFFFKSTFSLF